MKLKPEQLWQTYQSLKECEPALRIRDAAAKLNVSEAELVAADPDSIALACDDWKTFLPEMKKLGRVMVLTRNEACVHEKKGNYEPVSFEGGAGLVLNRGVDLRIFLRHWHYGFSVTQAKGEHTLRSFQFFDAAGFAVHKIFLTDDSDVAAFEALTREFGSAEKIAVLPEPRAAKKAELPDEQIDVASLRQDWLALKDVHEFHGVLQKYKVSRPQAFRLAPEGHAWTIAPSALDTLFARASETETPIMVFVGNSGCIQIHSGPIVKIDRRGAWLNILDPDFNLHLRTDLVHEVWVVKKPGDCGMLTSIEAFDADGESIMTLFGERKPGVPELASWVRLVSELGVEDAVED